jgi:hypothetical protein
MSLRKQVLESKEQMVFDLLEEDLRTIDEFVSDEDEEFLTLLEQVLTEVFVPTPDEESLEYLEGNAIYDLADEKEICNREKFDHLSLNEGSPEVEDLNALEEVSRDYFENPRVYPLDEESIKPNHVTGFLQIYSGEKFDNHGHMKEVWKSSNMKVIVKISDLLDPDCVISIIEKQGIKWGPVFRVVFYGNPLVDIIGSRFYSEHDAKELLPLTDQHPNILLALPDYRETEEHSESIFDWLDLQIQEGIAFGILPDVDRVTIGHHEYTAIRLQEVFEEELEEKSLRQIVKRESLAVTKKNQFIDTFSEARAFIVGANTGNGIDQLYSLSLKHLEDILFLCTKSFERINDPLVYAQVRSLATKMKVNSFKLIDSKALMIIQKINGGELVETHLIPLPELEAIFGILWSNIGIKIVPEKKEIYFDLKERLRVLRAKFGTSNKGKAG